MRVEERPLCASVTSSLLHPCSNVVQKPVCTGRGCRAHSYEGLRSWVTLQALLLSCWGVSPPGLPRFGEHSYSPSQKSPSSRTDGGREGSFPVPAPVPGASIFAREGGRAQAALAPKAKPKPTVNYRQPHLPARRAARVEPTPPTGPPAAAQGRPRLRQQPRSGAASRGAAGHPPPPQPRASPGWLPPAALRPLRPRPLSQRRLTGDKGETPPHPGGCVPL